MEEEERGGGGRGREHPRRGFAELQPSDGAELLDITYTNMAGDVVNALNLDANARLEDP